MSVCMAYVDWTVWVSITGSIASIVALCLAVGEWQRVKTVRRELEQQRDYLAKLHFLPEYVRQLREFGKDLDNHRKYKRWEQTGRELRKCLGVLESMRPRLDPDTWEPHELLVSEIRVVLNQLPVGDDRVLTTAVFRVSGHLDQFAVIVNNVAEEHRWRYKL